jgi:hypothetical protein
VHVLLWQGLVNDEPVENPPPSPAVTLLESSPAHLSSAKLLFAHDMLKDLSSKSPYAKVAFIWLILIELEIHADSNLQLPRIERLGG